MARKKPVPQLDLDRALMLYRDYALDLSARRVRNMVDVLALWRRMRCVDQCDRITTATFQQFRKRCLKKRLAAATIESAVGVIKTLLRHLGPQTDSAPHGLGLIAAVPFTGRRLKVFPEPKLPASYEQRLLHAAVDPPRGGHRIRA